MSEPFETKYDFTFEPIGTDPFEVEMLRALRNRMADDVAKAFGIHEDQIFMGGNSYTTGTAASMDDCRTLTMEKLQESIDQIGKVVLNTYARRPFFGLPPLPVPVNAFGVPIYTSKYMGKMLYPEHPAMPKGPYLKRRIKRWHRAHPAYTVGNGVYYMMRDQIWCHPDDLTVLQKEILRQQQGKVEL